MWALKKLCVIKVAHCMGLDAKNPVFGVSDKGDSNQSPQLQSLKIEISFVASLDRILPKKRITKVLISLPRCAGWSAPLLFANPEDRFSRIKAHIYQRAFKTNFEKK